MPDRQPATIHHSEIAATLESEIGGGQWSVGDRFPTEADLQSRFGVGRYSVRKALSTLTEKGLITRRRKAGSFVTATQPVTPFIHRLRDIRGLIEFGRTTELEVQQRGLVSPAIPDGSITAMGRYYRIAGPRRRVSDRLPLCWTEIMVAEIYSEVCKDSVLRGSVIYEKVLVKFKLKLGHVEQSIYAVSLKPALAAVLEAEGEVAALVVERRYLETSGQVFEMVRNIYPASRYVVKTTFRQS